MIDKVPVVLEIERVLEISFTSTQELAGRTALVARVDATRQYELVDAIEPRAVAWDDTGYTVILGALDDGPHRVFAIPVVDPILLMQVFDVGSHNDFSPGGDTPARARAAMQKLLRDAPFVPFFLDAAGMKVRFVDPVPAELAEQIEDEVLEFDLEALSLIDGEDEDASGDEPPSLAASIQRTQRLQLWWD